MTELLQKAFAAARELPAEHAGGYRTYHSHTCGDDETVVTLTAEEEASFAEALAQAARGEFATDEEVCAVWAKHGL